MWSYPKIIAHRGGGSLAPENTLAGFQCGFNHGFRAVEFDVMLTKDHIPVVIHDEQLGRTVPGQGLICALLAAEIGNLDAGSWFSPEFAGVNVPTYRQVLEFCTQHGIWMNVEIKPADGFDEITGEVVGNMTRQFYAASPGLPLPLFSSFSMPALSVAQRVAPSIPRAALFDQIPSDWKNQLVQLQAVALHTNHRYLTSTIADQIKQSEYGLSCYTVNQPERARELFSWGVDAIFTDSLQLIPANFA